MNRGAFHSGRREEIAAVLGLCHDPFVCAGAVTLPCVTLMCSYTHTKRALCSRLDPNTHSDKVLIQHSQCAFILAHSFLFLSHLFSPPPPRLFLTTPKIWRFSRVCLSPQLYGNQAQTGKWPPSLVGTPLSSTPLLPQTKSCLDTCWEWCWD